jgi:hypothetical protein
MSNERDDDAERRARANVHASARIGAAAALTIVLSAILALLGLEASAFWKDVK